LGQTREHADRLEKELSNAIKDFPARCAEPLKLACEQTKQTLDRLADALMERFEQTENNLATRVGSLASAADTVTSSLEEVQSRLKAMRTPDQIIELKLQPFIDGLTSAVNKLDEGVGKLADGMAEEGRNRRLDQQFVRELVSPLEAASAESRQLLTDINKKLSVRSFRAPERNGLFFDWLKGLFLRRFRGTA
jgi:X-X-X-Leu-X-X-Gly heptad repeat protein